MTSDKETVMELDGRSVLVVGATGGLGRELVALLSSRGARLTLAGRSLERLAALPAPGAAMVAGDLAVPADPARFVAAAVEAHGGLDGVVNAAGVVAFGGLTDLDDATLERLFAVDVLGPLRLMRAAVPFLAASSAAGGTGAGGGFVVNVSAVVAEQPVANMVAYSAAKAALTAADVGLARELRRQKIHVLDARPPHTETGLAERPIAGVAPRLPQGLAAGAVAARIIAALEAGERDLPSAAFAS